MPRFVSLILVLLVCLIAYAPEVKAAKATRTLTGIDFSADDALSQIHLAFEGDTARPLGRVYYSDKLIRVVISKTSLAKGQKKLLITPKDDLVTKVYAYPRKGAIQLKIYLKKKVQSIMERIDFEPGATVSTISFRKEPFYTRLAQRERPGAQIVQVIETGTKTPDMADDEEKPTAATVNSLLPLVNPKRNPAASATPDPLAEAARQKTLAQLLGEDAEEATAGVGEKKNDELIAAAKENKAKDVAADAGKPPSDPMLDDSKVETVLPNMGEKRDGIQGVGDFAPDLTNLYWMAGMMVLVALLWLLARRGKLMNLQGVNGPLKVIKSQSLGGKQRLLIVEVEGKRLLLSSSDKELRLITEIDRDGAADEQMKAALMSGIKTSEANAQDPNLRVVREKKPGIAKARPAAKPPVASGERPSYFGFKDGSKPAETGLREKLRALRRGR